VTCFAIDSGHRRSGVGSALLTSAVEFARAQGATAVEGHPVDVAGLSAARVGGSAIYTGTVAMFPLRTLSKLPAPTARGR
jgi:GNAT superfamily N-acetyltransferase